MKIQKLFLSTVIAAVLMFVLSTSLFAQESVTNLLDNGSCEVVDKDTDHPTGWVGGHAKNTSWLTVPDGINYCYVLTGETMYQEVEVKADHMYSLTFHSGTHVVHGQSVSLQYISPSNTVVAESIHLIKHIVDTDKQLAGAYTLTLPVVYEGVMFVRVKISSPNNWAKVDLFDLQAIPLPTKGIEESEEPEQSNKLFLPIISLQRSMPGDRSVGDGTCLFVRKGNEIWVHIKVSSMQPLYVISSSAREDEPYVIPIYPHEVEVGEIDRGGENIVGYTQYIDSTGIVKDVRCSAQFEFDPN